MAAGAAGGILGYRRAVRLGRAITHGRGRTGTALGALASAAAAAGEFGRDVQEGMTRYMQSRPPRSGPTLIGQQPRAERAIPGSVSDKDGR
jgi:hypothetical protein